MFAAGKTAAVSGAGPDAQFNYVTMLLHGDGTNGAQNNTFVDSSTNNFTITRNGNTTQGSFSPYGSNWSNYFNGSGYLSLTSNSSLNFGTGDFTIECWLNISSLNGGVLIDFRPSSTNGDYPLIYQAGSGFEFYASGGTQISSGAITIGTWFHFALCRSGSSMKMFFNGTQTGSTYTASVNYSVGSILGIATSSFALSSSVLDGYISNLRVLKGTALYTTTFTPPTTPLTAITNTSLLTCQSNRFIDNSTNVFAITATNSPSVQRFNPFGASTAYSTSVIGGSGYFDGSGDYLTAASTTAFDIASGTDFTFSCWVYFTSNPNNGTIKYIFDQTSTSGSGSVIFLAQETGNAWTACSMSNAYSSSDFVAGQWYWITISRVSGTLRSFKNGTLITSGANTDASDTNRFTIAARYSDNYILNSAYLTDVRFVVGSGVTSDTVPTAPLTAITNTALLCNMTNGAIFDNAMMNDLETVGNAQISTSVVKYGTGSIYFDGTGDYLLSAPSNDNILGSGDFTIEFWLYPSNTSSGYRALVSSENYAGTTGGWSLYQNGTSVEFWITPGMTITLDATSAITASTWQHLALCRASGTLRLFVNGTSVASVSNSTSLTGQQIWIGDNNAGSYFFNGYIDDLRITKGYARYTANFTPPTTAFSNTGPI